MWVRWYGFAQRWAAQAELAWCQLSALACSAEDMLSSGGDSGLKAANWGWLPMRFSGVLEPLLWHFKKFKQRSAVPRHADKAG
jgi:hypothetical protein